MGKRIRVTFEIHGEKNESQYYHSFLHAHHPTLPLAVTVSLLRFSISQMDVPTRQSYTMAVVSPDERSAASGVTSTARSVGAAISPSLTGIFLAVPTLLSVPFFLAGGLKIVYDVLLYRGFRAMKPPEEKWFVSSRAVRSAPPPSHLPRRRYALRSKSE